MLEKWKCFLLGKNQLITLKLVPENNLFEIIVVYYLDKNSKAFKKYSGEKKKLPGQCPIVYVFTLCFIV